MSPPTMATPSPLSQTPHPKLVNTQTARAGQESPQPVARRVPPQTKQTPPSEQLYAKKVPHRSGQPIINWLQRKLGGSARARRIPDGNSLGVAQKTIPNTKSHLGVSTASTSRPSGRTVSSPWPQVTLATSQRQAALNPHRRTLSSGVSQRRTISLNDAETEHNHSLLSGDDDNLDDSTRSSLARDSMWSPASALEADEDASLRPLPPSSPPSPSLSNSSSSYISHPQTFRSIAASTKPTTVLSIDLLPAGVAHIAQVPVTPVSQISPRHALHARSSSTGTNGGLVGSGGSITFSAFPLSPQSASHPPSSTHPNLTSSNSALLGHHVHGLQAPLHTAHHPRNNPRPSSPPLDNASVLTLASSAYAIPGARTAIGSLGSATLSGLIGGGDSISHLGGSVLGDLEGENTSQLLADDDRLEDRKSVV